MNAATVQIDPKRLGLGGHGHDFQCSCALCQNKRPVASRLADKIRVEPNGCWEWTGKIASDGYGMITIDGVETRAHRASFDNFVRKISPAEMILHRCDNRPCISPVHLFAGSRSDNNRDMADKGRARNRNSGKAVCDHGHPFTEENTVWDRRGYRNCRSCHAQKLRDYRAKRRAA